MMDAIKLSLFNIFVGHRYLQHAGAEYSEPHMLRYHVYFGPNGILSNDTIAFAYLWSTDIAGPAEGNFVDKSETVAFHEEDTLDVEVVGN